jgi:hypothetical protein
MGVLQWSALAIGVALVAWPVFQMTYGRPQLSFAFARSEDRSRAFLLVNVHNPPVANAALVQMGVRRDDANGSVSVAIIDERGDQVLNYAYEQFHLRGGHAPVALRILAFDADAARIDYDAPGHRRDLAPGTYAVRITVRLGERTVSAQRMFVVTQRRERCYWADA